VDNSISHFSSQVVSGKHVNLVDLVHQESRENIQIFKSEKELSEYTHETEKFFPKESAVDGGVLRALRRHILNPQESQYRRARGQSSQPGNLRQLRAFHSRVPIPSRDCGDTPGVSAQPYLNMSSSPYAFKFNSPMALIHHSCPSALLSSGTTSPNLALAAAQRGYTTTIPTTLRSNYHVMSHVGHFSPGHHRSPPPPPLPLSSFPPLKLPVNSHDHLNMSYHHFINRTDIPRPTRVSCPRGVGPSPLFQYGSSLPRVITCMRRVIFPV
jgi:hypothetical protein